MKKVVFVVLIPFLISFNVFSQKYNKQNTYIDALDLKNIFNQKRGFGDEGAVADYYKILGKYEIKTSNIDSNIFLKDLKIHIVSAMIPKGGKAVTTLPEVNAVIPATASSLNWQASAINGLASFMAGSFKQEALQVAINQLFKQITKEDAALVKSVFPKTYSQIYTLYGGSSVSYYTADLLLLRQTAQLDIDKLPNTIVERTDSIFPLLKSEPKIKDMLLVGNYIVEYSKQGQSLDRLLSSLATESYSPDSTIYTILNVADLLSQALIGQKTNENTIWVNPLDDLPISSLVLSPTISSDARDLEVRFFYGLLYQQLKGIPGFDRYLADGNPNDMRELATKMQDLVRFVNKLNNTYLYISSKKFDLKSAEDMVTYISNIDESLRMFTTTLNRIPQIKSRYRLDNSLLDVSGKYISITAALIRKDYQKVIPLLTIELGSYMVKNPKATRTLTFISQLATIETGADMEALLQSYALPIGSSSIKRQSAFNVSVNGYVGFTGGFETAYGSAQESTKGNVGLAAPIGISTTLFNGYLTPFVSFIDLGSIVNARLSNDSESYTNLKLEHFFTPGLGLFLNLPEFPVSAGFHFNYIPNYRSIKYENGNTTITESSRSVSRMNFSLLVDLPFFTIYNQQKANRYNPKGL